MKLCNFMIDDKKSNGGEWVDFELGGDFCQLKIARMQNPKHIEVARELMKPYKNQQNISGTIPVEDALKINIECIAKSILIDWKGVEGDDGKNLPYTEDAGISYLTRVPELYEFVNDVSLENENFRIKALESASKN